MDFYSPDTFYPGGGPVGEAIAEWGALFGSVPTTRPKKMDAEAIAEWALGVIPAKYQPFSKDLVMWNRDGLVRLRWASLIGEINLFVCDHQFFWWSGSLRMGSPSGPLAWWIRRSIMS